jgi:hypothetical protein
MFQTVTPTTATNPFLLFPCLSGDQRGRHTVLGIAVYHFHRAICEDSRHVGAESCPIVNVVNVQLLLFDHDEPRRDDRCT